MIVFDVQPSDFPILLELKFYKSTSPYLGDVVCEKNIISYDKYLKETVMASLQKYNLL